MSLQTTQSRKVTLTEDEKAYFAKTTDEDLRKISQNLKQAREDVTTKRTTDTNNYYKDEYVLQGAQPGKQPTHYPPFDDPYEATAIRVGSRLLAEIISKYVIDKNAQLLDAGAGSGYLSVEVKKLGFPNIDCLEPCKSMIDMQPKGLFGNVYEEIISCAKPCTIKTGSYGCVMLNATVLSGHIEVHDFPDLLRIVKPGGYAIFNIPDYWHRYKDYGVRLDAMLQTSLESGSLAMVVKERSVYVYPFEDATIYVLQKPS